MKSGLLCGCMVAGLLAGFSLVAHAEAKDNPYQLIIERNPFGLKPIPPPPPVDVVTSAPPAPPLEVKLTGISTLSGEPKVFLEVNNTQTKKVDRPSAMLAGEKQFEIEVLSIDPDQGIVRINNAGQEQTLDFVNNGIKAASGGGGAPPPPPAPGIVPLNTGIPGSPMAVAPTANSRAIVAGGGGAAGMPGANPSMGMANPMMGAGGIPPRTLRADIGGRALVAGGGTTTPQANAAPASTGQPLSREEVEMRIEAQRRYFEQKEQSGQMAPGMSPARILPPTRFSAPAPPGPGMQAQ